MEDKIKALNGKFLRGELSNAEYKDEAIKLLESVDYTLRLHYSRMMFISYPV